MESMEHILTKCTATGQDVIWDLAGELCKKRGIKWAKLNIGHVMGCHLIMPKFRKGKMTGAGKRMYMITVTKSAHLIWKLRCKWKIQRDANPERIHTAQEIRSRWETMINNRIKIDCLAANSNRYKDRALEMDMVCDT